MSGPAGKKGVNTYSVNLHATKKGDMILNIKKINLNLRPEYRSRCIKIAIIPLT